jgi:segregation and condensation protein A
MTQVLEPSNPTAPPLETVFVARFEGFEGSLLDLAAQLRSGGILPVAVPLLQLTREVLERYARLKKELPPGDAIELSSEALPHLSSVIELKARLLLPKPPRAKIEEDSESIDATLEEVLSGVQALAQLEGAIGFLKEKRLSRTLLLLPAVPEIKLPRKHKPLSSSLGALVQAAHRRVREVNLFDLSFDRLTMPQALERLKQFAKNLRRFFFKDVPARDWGERTVLFSTLLETVREGQFEAQQLEPYGDIEITKR